MICLANHPQEEGSRFISILIILKATLLEGASPISNYFRNHLTNHSSRGAAICLDIHDFKDALAVVLQGAPRLSLFRDFASS